MAAHTSSTPTFPVPASARVHPATTSTTAVTPFKSTLNARALTHARSKHSAEALSTGAIAIAVVAALLVLACIGWALARRRAFEPHWLLSLRHAMTEAGFRASSTWAEFSDWVRLGH